MKECEVINQTFESDEDVVRCFFRGGSEWSNVVMLCRLPWASIVLPCSSSWLF
jgi:hypothetical protein